MNATKTVAIAVTAGLFVGATAHAQVRIAQWNITNWSASSVAARGQAFQTSIYAVAPNGLSMSPDILIAEEITQGGTPSTSPPASAYTTTGQNNVNAFLNLLNTAPNSPGDWTAAPYVANQGDTGNALFYRTSKVTFVSSVTLGTSAGPNPDVGSGSNQSPRDNQRWLVRLVGYTGPGAQLYLYGGHFKAGEESSDQVRRQPEGLRIRNDANALPPGTNFILGADMNVQSSSQPFYQYMTVFSTSFGSSDPRFIQSGLFYDPILRPGSWNNNSAYSNIHTQEPATQMDDRHDQLLISASLRTGQGMSYIPLSHTGNILVPFRAYSTASPYDSNQWNDPNHSYRCWGNDGNHYNAPINTNAANTEVGQAIADALVTTVAGNGHLGVYLDMQVPARLGAPTGTIDLGSIVQDGVLTYDLSVTNAADVARFSKDGTGWGIDPLTYHFAFSDGSPFSMPAGTGPFDLPAASPAHAALHTIVLDTSTPGLKTATFTISTDDSENPTREIALTAMVESGAQGACCVADGECSLTTRVGCAAAYQGDDSTCLPSNPCPQPTGACCTGTRCDATTEAGCAGAFQGVGIACGPTDNPTTCCPANFNLSGGLTVSDIFQYLGAWFGGSAGADFNNDGTISIQDIFDFLSAWFSGC
jgi:hypothetical protein